MSTTFDSINKLCDKPNAKGLQQKLYIIPLTDVESIPAPTLNLTVDQDIVLVTGKVFKHIEFSPNDQGYTSKRIGDEDGKVSETEVNFFVPEMSSFKSAVLGCNDSCPHLVLVQDKNKKFRIVGEVNNGAYISADEQSNPKNGYVTKVMWKESAQPPLYYTGAIPT